MQFCKAQIIHTCKNLQKDSFENMFLAVQDSSIGDLVTESLGESSFDFRVTMTTLTTMNTMTTMTTMTTITKITTITSITPITTITTMNTMTTMDSVTSMSTETAI